MPAIFSVDLLKTLGDLSRQGFLVQIPLLTSDSKKGF